jgi:hypothetical protein
MRCDFHIHTSYSYDGLSLPKEIVKAAILRQIDCICITDHNEIKGAVEALHFAFDKPILIIPGIEIKSKEGDILGINIKEKIENNLSARETIKKIQELGGMVIIPHPFGFLCSFKGNLEELVNEFDDAGVEALNASLFGAGNALAQNFTQKLNLAFTAGSDAHIADFVGKVYLEIPRDNLSAKEVVEEIKNRQGSLGGKGATFFEKIIGHAKRSIAKIRHIY